MTLVRSRNGGINRHSVIFSRGLRNDPGENNCFMNSAVQVLWHLDVFRRSFRLLEGHACLEECCIFCALKEIFGKFQESDEGALPPDVLRNAMAKAFQDQRKFQIGRMGDAAECFENILRRLHDHITFGGPEDICNAKYCIPHQKFSMQIVEQTFCECGATSEPFNYFETVNYVAASALIEEAKQPQRNGYKPYTSFAELLKATLAHGGGRQCPDDEKCGHKDRESPTTKMHRTLLNCPDIVCIGISWNTDRPSAEYVMDLLDCLGRKLEVRDLFDSLSDDRAKKMKLKLFGIMTYYGKHYTTFVYNTRQETWLYFDDATVQEIGKDWNMVKDRCRRGKHQPLLVFYVNQDGETIKANKAPRKTEIMSKEELIASRNNNEKEQQRRLDKKASKRKGKKKDRDDEDRNPPGRRKSLKNFVSSAFKKDRSSKEAASGSSSSKSRQRSNGDHVLSVNGHDSSMGVIGPYLEINGYVTENRSVEVENETRKSPVNSKERAQSQTSPLSKDDESVFRYDSPKKVDGRSSEAHRLQKHQAHLKSLETSIDNYESEEDILDSKRQRHRRSKSQQLPVEHVDREKESSRFIAVPKNTVEDGRRQTSGKIHEQEHTSKHQAQRRYIDNGDAYADDVSDADRLVICSISAEQEGNLYESYRFCTDAKALYRNAMDLDGITEKMRGHADKKRWETNNRLRLLNEKISELRRRGTKSADYDRQVSKTSDYGSLSDASGSPLGQSQNGAPSYQKFSKEASTGNQVYPIVEKGGIQAKLNKERSRLDTSKGRDDPTKSIFFTLPRKKKSNQEKKASAQEPPTQSEIDQLSDLLTNLNTFDYPDHRRGSSDFEKNRIQHRSEPYLASSSNASPNGSANRFKMEPTGDTRKAMVRSVDGNPSYLSKAMPADLGMANSQNSNGFSVPEVGRPDAPRVHDLSNGPRTISRNHQVVTAKSERRPESPSPGFKVNGDVGSQKTKFRNEKSSTGSIDASYQTLRRSPQYGRKHRSETGISGMSFESENIVSSNTKLSKNENGDDATTSSIETFEAQNKYDSCDRPEETDRQGADRKEINGKPVERKKSIFKVIVPKIMSIERVRSVKKAKKAPDTREEEYRAMLKAQAHMTSEKNGLSEQLGTKSKSTTSRELGSPSQLKDEVRKRSTPGLDFNLHERSIDSLECSESARKEVDAVTKAVTEEILFSNVGKRRLSRDNNVHEDSAASKDFSSVKQTRSQHSASPGNDHSQVIVNEKDQSRVTQKGLRMVGSPSTSQPRSSVERFAFGDKNPGTMSSNASAYFRNAVSQTNIVQRNVKELESDMKDYNEGPASEGKDSGTVKKVQKAVEFFSKSQPDISEYSSKECKQPLEPPPRKNPDVYRSSELYKHQAEKQVSASPERTAIPNQHPVEGLQSSSVKVDAGRGNASRWGNGVDFANSTRQMCQQCGTVTVEKPRKFCRQCQSDYL